MSDKNEIVLFKSSASENEFEIILDHENDTIWASEHQIADIFDRDRTVIGRHIRNIFKEEELSKNSVSAKFAHTASDGKTYQVMNYNLDVIISVGYRVKSKIATEFRKWATRKLKEYLIQGYSINQKLISDQTVKIKFLQKEINSLYHDQQKLTNGILELIITYSKSFELLSKYDNEELTTNNLNEEIIYVINYEDVINAIKELRDKLIAKGEAGALFGNEKDDSFKGILGSISQTVFGQLAYPTIEEQAAQLLYSTIKGHSFSDGNKRIGSFLFVWYLEQNEFHLKPDGSSKISDNTLVTLALAVAQSLPEQRELIIKLIINLIKN